MAAKQKTGVQSTILSKEQIVVAKARRKVVYISLDEYGFVPEVAMVDLHKKVFKNEKT